MAPRIAVIANELEETASYLPLESTGSVTPRGGALPADNQRHGKDLPSLGVPSHSHSPRDRALVRNDQLYESSQHSMGVRNSFGASHPYQR